MFKLADEVPREQPSQARRNPLVQKLENSTMFARTAQAAAAAIVFLLAAPVHAQDLPEGAGKEIVMKVCTTCHGIDHFTGKKKTKDEWNDTVDKMAQRGAQASDEEFATIVTYLTKYFGTDPPPAKSN